VLSSFPLLPNGKINRQALPAPEKPRPELDGNYQAPRNATEELVREIWSEVLEIPKIGIHDDFFELGGHSLMVTQVLARLRERVQIDLPMRVIFDAPTIAGFAEVLEEKLVSEISALSEEEALRQLGANLRS
jgi:acyl carrier protein